jgi:hypothetical protein
LQNSLSYALQKSSDLESTSQKMSVSINQLGERLQQSNEDLANEMDYSKSLEIKNSRSVKIIAKMTWVIIVLGAVVLVYIALRVCKLFRVPWAMWVI